MSLVTLTCSFSSNRRLLTTSITSHTFRSASRLEQDTPALETTALELSLSSTAAAQEPVAWSMMPTRITDPTQLSTTVPARCRS